MGNAALAELSRNLVTSALVVYALAMVAYAAEIAFGARSRIGAAATPGARRPAYPPARRGSVGGGATAATAVVPPRVADQHGAVDPPADRLGRIAVSLTLLAFGLHAAGVVVRGLSAGRVPWGNMYEFSITGALAATGAYLIVLRRYPVRSLGVVVVPVVLLTLGLAVTVLYTDAAELVPALRSYWLVIHVLAAILSAGGFTVGAAVAALYLLRARAEHRGRLGIWTGRLPAADRLDRLGYQVHAFTFPIYTFMVIAGAIWAESAWGRYWGWDPKETWAFITWVVYAGYLHARATAGWRGRGAALIALTGYACFTFNYFGINLIVSGLHSYAGVG